MGIVSIINIAFEVFEVLIIIRILLSWIRLNPYNAIVRFIYDITEPIMAPFRKIIPPLGGIDFSPIVVFIVLEIVRSLMIVLINAL